MNFQYALVKKPASTYSQGITSGLFGVPDYELTLTQHQAYCQALEHCGVKVIVLAPDERFPDSTFVEDTAIVGKDFAVITNPGDERRRGEIKAVEEAIKTIPSFKRIYSIRPPGTVDGGDICEADGHYFIGISQRTNQAGGEQLAQFLFKEGFSSTFVDIRGIPTLLHLKSGMAYLRSGEMILVEELEHTGIFKNYSILHVEPNEAYAANCILVNDKLLFAQGFPKIQSVLEKRGYDLMLLNMSEFQKMDGGLSCLSLRF